MVERNLTEAIAKNKANIDAIQAKSGVDLKECYQCGKCSAGCSMAAGMDLKPREVVRYLQLGLWDDVLKSNSPWICASCHTCVARCPHNVDIPSLMEAVRQEAKRQGIVPVKEVDVFTNVFIDSVKKNGKLHDLMLTGMYNMKSGHLMQDAWAGAPMLKSGKVGLRPHTVKDKEAVRRLIKNSLKRGESK